MVREAPEAEEEIRLEDLRFDEEPGTIFKLEVDAHRMFLRVEWRGQQ